MWKCKKCGEKILGYYTGLVDIDKNGCAIDGTQQEEEVQELIKSSKKYLDMVDREIMKIKTA